MRQRCWAQIPTPGRRVGTLQCSRWARPGHRTCAQHRAQEKGVVRARAWKCLEHAGGLRARGEEGRARAMEERGDALLALIGEGR